MPAVCRKRNGRRNTRGIGKPDFGCCRCVHTLVILTFISESELLLLSSKPSEGGLWDGIPQPILQGALAGPQRTTSLRPHRPFMVLLEKASSDAPGPLHRMAPRRLLSALTHESPIQSHLLHKDIPSCSSSIPRALGCPSWSLGV